MNTDNIIQEQNHFFVEFAKILTNRCGDSFVDFDQKDQLVDRGAQDFARYLQAARVNAGWSPQELATQASLSEAEIMALERGLILSTKIKPGSLHAIAKALGEDIEDFALILECEIPQPDPTGVVARLRNAWRASVAYFGSKQKTLLVGFLILATIISLAIFTYSELTQDDARPFLPLLDYNMPDDPQWGSLTTVFGSDRFQAQPAYYSSLSSRPDHALIQPTLPINGDKPLARNLPANYRTSQTGQSRRALNPNQQPAQSLRAFHTTDHTKVFQPALTKLDGQSTLAVPVAYTRKNQILLIVILLFWLLWLAIWNGHLSLKIIAKRARRWERSLVYATPVTLLCILVMIGATLPSSADDTPLPIDYFEITKPRPSSKVGGVLLPRDNIVVWQDTRSDGVDIYTDMIERSQIHTTGTGQDKALHWVDRQTIHFPQAEDIPGYDPGTEQVLRYKSFEQDGAKHLIEAGYPAMTGTYLASLDFYYDTPDQKRFLGRFGRGFTYDQALTLIARTMLSQPAQAKDLGRYVSSFQNSGQLTTTTPGSFGFSFNGQGYWGDKDNFYDMDYLRGGANGWLGYGYLFYSRRYNDGQFVDEMARVADYSLALQVSDMDDDRYELFTGGYGRWLKGEFFKGDIAWVSAEHNIDIYFFLRDLGQMTRDSRYVVAANLLRENMVKMWNEEKGRLDQGVNDPSDVLDAASWGAMYWMPVGDLEKARRSLALGRFICDSCSDVVIRDFNQTNNTIWLNSGDASYINGIISHKLGNNIGIWIALNDLNEDGYVVSIFAIKTSPSTNTPINIPVYLSTPNAALPIQPAYRALLALSQTVLTLGLFSLIISVILREGRIKLAFKKVGSSNKKPKDNSP